MATTGHESELITVERLKDTLQKFKTEKVDTKVDGVSYDTTNKKLQKSVNGTASDVVGAATVVTDGGGVTSSTNGLKIELVDAMPASPNSGTIYIVK